jgi:hypothetical protein
MKENKEACDKYNDQQKQAAQQIVVEEAAAGNPHALPTTMGVIAVNADQVRPICEGATGDSGKGSDYGCTDGAVVVVNADVGAPVMAAILVHETQHVFGSRTSGAKSRAAGETCANKRQTLFVYNMQNQAQKNAALADPQVRKTQNPNAPGCGFN